MTVLKKKKNDLKVDLLSAVEKFVQLLESQKEQEAVEVLRAAATKLRSAIPESDPYRQAIAEIFEAFEGEHELSAYIHQREDTGEWTEADELSAASYKVLSLVRRMQT